MRLNKLLARAGVASRRAAEELIAGGRVSVNGVVVTDLGHSADPERDAVRLDGELVSLPRERVYIAFHKPRNVLTTVSDPRGRPTVMDYIDVGQRVFPVGRLDWASEGLVLLTNDGDLAHALTHPSRAHARVYRVKVSGTPTAETLRAWATGMHLEDGRTAPADVSVESGTGPSTWVRFGLREGRNRQIRRMVEARRHTVHRLVRVAFGPVTLGDLAVGTWRPLTRQEIDALAAAVGLDAPRAKRRSAGAYGKGWARPKTLAHGMSGYKPRRRRAAGRVGGAR
jgi:pseudouridine synthase